MAFQIKAVDFTKDGGKKKFNWFFYELACEIAMELTKPRMLKLLRKEGIVERKIAHACQQMSLVIKEPILAKLSKQAEAVHLNYTIVEAAFPKISDRSVNTILDAVTRAYNKQTEVCVMCPTRCISEKDEECGFFFDTDVNESTFGVTEEANGS